MYKNQELINQLLQRIEDMSERQASFYREIMRLKDEIRSLQGNEAVVKPENIQEQAAENPTVTQQPELIKILQERKLEKDVAAPQAVSSEKKPLKFQQDLEKFIGENLINKIGIAITVIGVAIGAKYSIEHDLISPLTRIILGYLAGMALLAVGIKLKVNYKSYSAVLVSGAMTIMYFITFAGYSFYELIPVSLAFGLMVMFTIFTVIAAMSYNMQVIAHIGLVGAYAVPFLLSNDSGNVEVLFSYMAILNTGILVLAFKKYWKNLYYAAFLLSWTIYIFWFVSDFDLIKHFRLALIFAFAFFVIFYATFLAYKLIKKENFNKSDTVFLLLNSFIFYAIAYAVLDQHEIGEQLLGLFTIGNAIIHFIVSIIIFRQQLSERSLFYMVAGLVLVFVTIAIPVQLDGRWVTLLWVGEATLLFWIGRTKAVPVYERLSYILMLLAAISLGDDWSTIYGRYIANDPENYITPFFNVHFLSSALFISAFGFINYLFIKNQEKAASLPRFFNRIVRFSIPAVFLFVLFYAIRLEIANYWNQLFAFSEIEIKDDAVDYYNSVQNYNLMDFKHVWILNYSMLFFALLSIVALRKIKTAFFGLLTLGLNLLVLLIFLSQGLFALSDLREAYLGQFQGEYFHVGQFNLVIRYISFAFLAPLLLCSYWLVKQDYIRKPIEMLFYICLHIAMIWILSSELIHWLDIYGSDDAYKLGLTILWGVYALFLIVMGIWKKHKYLRVGAIILFAGTLVKLFFYDVSHLDTIAKTIVFVSLGILLLIISFLYNKYKHVIADEDKD